MKIIHSVFTTGWGGLEKYPLTLQEGLEKEGHELIIVTLQGTKLYEEALKRKIKVYGIEKFKKINFGIVNFLKEIVKNENVEIVHMNSSREAYNWYLALWGNKKVKSFLTFHIGIPKNKSFLHKMIYGKIHRIFAICQNEANEMKERLAVDKDKIKILHNGVDLNKFNTNATTNFRNEFSIKDDEIVVTSIGNLSKGKGILEWVEATKEISISNDKIRFFWIGDDSHITEEYTLESLRENLKELGFDKEIKLLGYRTDIPNILKGSDLFVLPSHKESFGIVYIEAMAMGLPVIGCNSGGVPDIIKEGRGFLCEPKDSNSLKNTIEKALKSDLKKMGMENSKRVEEFSMENHIKKLLEEYGNGSVRK